MKAAYVDTSCLLALAFDEPRAKGTSELLDSYDAIFSSNLLEAELRAAFARENVDDNPEPLLRGIWWIHPDRALTSEFSAVLAQGYVRGADLWHLAAAVFFSPERQIDFLTRDERQREISARLGFSTPRL